MKIKQYILNSNPDIIVNILKSDKKLNYTVKLDNHILESDSGDADFEDIEDLKDDLREFLADRLQEKYSDIDALFTDEFIEKIEEIK